MNIFRTNGMAVYVGEPGTPAPDVNDIDSSEWKQLTEVFSWPIHMFSDGAYMTREAFAQRIDYMIAKVRKSTIEEIEFSDYREPMSREVFLSDDKNMQEWFSSYSQPSEVERIIQQVSRHDAQYIGKHEDSVNDALLDGTL